LYVRKIQKYYFDLEDKWGAVAILFGINIAYAILRKNL